MSNEHQPELEETPATPARDYEPPAIIVLGKLDEITFGAAGPPFEGATSYL